MDLNALQLFVTIMDSGSLSAAARQLKMTKANVSYRLKAFEKELGAELLRRTTRNMAPTHVGLQMYEHGRNILREMAAASAAVSSAGNSLTGHVRVSVSTGLGHAIVSDLLIEFRCMHPGVSLDVIFSNQISNMVLENIDIALRIISTPPESTVATKLADVDWVVCACPRYMKGRAAPQCLEDLRELDIVCSSAIGQKLKITGTADGRVERVQLEPAIRSENFLFLKQAIMGGTGAGFLPSYTIKKELEEGTIIRLLEGFRISVFGSKVYLLTMPSRFRTMATTTLIHFLKQRFSDDS
jgi:DNA-binding transcriptional LysR family regulator